MNILLTNDDGFRAAGIRALYAALKERGHTVWLIAPVHQQSGVGHSLTVFEPLRARQFEQGDCCGIAIYGTPADCVKLGLSSILPCPPDLVISGINAGPNTGPDILYSGTVGAATEACHVGLPSMAVSDDQYGSTTDIEAKARHAVLLAESVNWAHMPRRRVVNVNYPGRPLAACRGVKVCPQSLAVWQNGYLKRTAPNGQPYWWIQGEIPIDTIETGSDRALLTEGYITVSSICFDFIDEKGLAALHTMKLHDTRD